MITTNFKVVVTNPARKEKDGGLKKNTILTVYGMIPDQHVDGTFFIYFLIYSPTKKNFMLEPAYQFVPHEE